ncbi:MAG TPA: hypothetical protein VMA34_19365 [Terracidiphilus sp.]|nr:hypothetical protein [Terracidiphilus sp.]
MTTQESLPRGGARFLGFPLEGFGLFTSLLLAFAAAFFTFFAATFVAIVSLLVWNQILGHNINYADTYRYVGLPAGLLMLAIALPVFATLWIRAKLMKLRK